MSICYVMASLYPSGGNKMIVEHVKRLAARGHEAVVTVVTKHKSDDAKWLELEGVKIVDFNKAVLDNYTNIVATYWETYYSIKDLKLEGPRFHYFVQSKEEDFESNIARKNRVRGTLTDRSFNLFTEAKWIQEYLGINFGRNSSLVPNHVELPTNLDTTKRPRVKPIILIEGEALTPWKNISFGAKVARQLRPEMTVKLLTNIPYSKLAFNTAASFDEVISMVSWKESLELIAQADVLYRPSLLEGFNGAIAEAMCLGTPVVANKIPASYEQGIADWNCCLVDINQVGDTVSKIKLLLVNKSHREHIIANAKQTAKSNFSDWSKSIDILENNVFMEFYEERDLK